MNYLAPKMLIAVLLVCISPVLLAQDDADYEVVLPQAAQVCILPTAPDAIPKDAEKDDLLAAKKSIGTFQGQIETYRACLSEAEADNITPGNKQAIVASYNYSVEMEERVASRFNDAIRSYKARQGDG